MKFTATSRSVQGSSASRRLRRAGRVPAIVYGGHGEALNIELDHNEIYHALRKEEFHASVLDMDLEGKTQTVLLRAVQWHAYKQLVLHVDFQRVAAGEAVQIKVPLHFVNDDISTAVKLQGAVVSHVANEIEVKCLPKDLPQFIEVDLSGLDMEKTASFHLSELVVPKGVEFVLHNADDLLLAVATIPAGQVSDDAKASDEAQGSAE